MPGPSSGKYLIVLRVDYNPSIGADNNDNSAVKAVITDGEMRVWTVEKLEDGNYTLILEDQWNSKVDDDRVVVVVMPSPGTWTIQERDEGYYTIEVPNAKSAWTASEADPKNPVVLSAINDPIDPYQLWKFIPILED